jgi:hypothetical protein
MNPGQNNRQRVNLINFNPDEESYIKEYLYLNPSAGQDKVTAARMVLKSMSLEDKEKLAQEMGVMEDFPSA